MLKSWRMDGDCDFEHDGPASVLHGGSYEGEVIHTAAKSILVPVRPHRFDSEGKIVYEQYVRRQGSNDYDSIGPVDTSGADSGSILMDS
jgi:hypothetical protein